jgi:hypothetical protein
MTDVLGDCFPHRVDECGDPGRLGGGDLCRPSLLARTIRRVAPSRDRDSMLTVGIGPDLGDDAVMLSGRERNDQSRWRGGGRCGHEPLAFVCIRFRRGLRYYRMTRLPDIFAVNGSGNHWFAVSPHLEPQTRGFDRQELKGTIAACLLSRTTRCRSSRSHGERPARPTRRRKPLKILVEKIHKVQHNVWLFAVAVNRKYFNHLSIFYPRPRVQRAPGFRCAL